MKERQEERTVKMFLRCESTVMGLSLHASNSISIHSNRYSGLVLLTFE